MIELVYIQLASNLCVFECNITVPEGNDVGLNIVAMWNRGV